MDTPKPAMPQPWAPPQEQVPPSWIMSAKRGCAVCLGRLRIPPAGPPFSQGPNVGRYLCSDCWTLYWNEHPEDLADDESRRYVAEEARRILLRRQAAVLFQDGRSRVYKSSRGTVVFDLHGADGLAPNEFDAAKLSLLAKAIEAVFPKILASTVPPAVADSLTKPAEPRIVGM